MFFHYTLRTGGCQTVRAAHAVVAGAGRIVVLTGAGISTDSGIPDFRGPQGVWTKDPSAQRSSHISEYVADAAVRRRMWQMRLASPEVMCLDCGDRGPMAPVLDRLRAGEDDPRCLRCAGLLKSATVSFGQPLVTADLRRAEAAALHCDLLLAVGSTLTVSPACNVVDVAAGAGARVVIVNAQPTPYDAIAEAVVREPIGEALPALVRL